MFCMHNKCDKGGHISQMTKKHLVSTFDGQQKYKTKKIPKKLLVGKKTGNKIIKKISENKKTTEL